MPPSPTGNLHVGTARTALFNFLATRHYGGELVLRFEDTDPERSKKEFEQNIIDGLTWLGIEWDEGPFRQTERAPIYKKYLQKLLDDTKAFYCSHTKEELETEKTEQMVRKEPPRHICSQRDGTNQSGVIRLKNDESGTLTFTDLIRGDISFQIQDMGDFAIARTIDSALYHFAVVVDDYEMNITHVIRGEDGISNTPRHILIQRALGAPQPLYAHLPLVLGPDRSKMSKRHGSTSIDEYRKQGYLPEAIVNFIALLGWHPSGDRELFTMDELIAEFSLERIQKSGAIFDIEKLNWLNGEMIRKLSLQELATKLQPYLEDAGLIQITNSGMISKSGEPVSSEYIERIAALEQPRLKKLSDISESVDFFFQQVLFSAELLQWKGTQPYSEILENVTMVEEILIELAEEKYTVELLRAILMPLAEERGRGNVLWPLRVALSGKKTSPDPFEIMAVLGKNPTLARISHAKKLLEELV
jgi:nondiscriminating glutamyl-tRNA synthetase